MHGFPCRPQLGPGGIGALQHRVPFCGIGYQNRVQPEIALASRRLVHELNVFRPGERRPVPFGKPAFPRDETVKLFKLRATQRRVDIWEAVIVSGRIMAICPPMRLLGRCSEVPQTGARASSSVTTAPPPPVVTVLLPLKLRIAANPPAAAGLLPRREPSDSAESCR